MNGKQRVTDVSANDGFWHHLVVTWKSDSGEWTVYMDGQLKENGKGTNSAMPHNYTTNAN